MHRRRRQPAVLFYFALPFVPACSNYVPLFICPIMVVNRSPDALKFSTPNAAHRAAPATSDSSVGILPRATRNPFFSSTPTSGAIPAPFASARSASGASSSSVVVATASASPSSSASASAVVVSGGTTPLIARLSVLARGEEDSMR